MSNRGSVRFAAVPSRSSRSSGRRRSCGCCPAPVGSDWSSWPARWGCRRAPCTGSCARCSDVGFVEQDADDRQVPARRGAAAHGLELPRRQRAAHARANWSDALAARSGESVRIGTLHEGKVLIVHHVFRPDDTLPDPRRRARCCPLHATAMGKVLLAARRYAAGELARGRAWRLHAGTITDRPTRSAARWARSASAGWARRDRRDDAWARPSIAAPDRGPRGLVGGRDRRSPARWTGSATRKGRAAELVAYVREAARAISRELGARSRGRTYGRRMAERYVCRDRPGHHVHRAASSSTTAARIVVGRPAGAPADLPQARLGRARRRRDLAQRAGASCAEALDRRRHRRRQTRRPRHRQPARDDGAVGPRDRRARGQRDHLAGHAHRRALSTSCGGDAGARPLPRALRAAAGDLLLRARRSAGCSTTSPACASAPRRGEVLFGTMESWLIWNLTGGRATSPTSPTPAAPC